MALLGNASALLHERPSLAARVSSSPGVAASSVSRGGRLWNSSAMVRELHFGGGRGDAAVDRRPLSAAALPEVHSVIDTHSFLFLADFWDHIWDPQLDPSQYPVRIDLDPTREIIEERIDWQLGEQGIKTFFMGWALVFTWGCCVTASMNDKFYESDFYRDAGGNGTGHWIYDQQDREERAARQEMWSEDLMKEIEEKAEEVRKAEEEKEVELV